MMARSVFCAEGALGAAVEAAAKKGTTAVKLEADLGFRRSAVPGLPAEIDPTPMEPQRFESVRRDDAALVTGRDDAALVTAEQARDEALEDRLAENSKLKYDRIYKSLEDDREGARDGTVWHPGRIEVAVTNRCEEVVIVNIVPPDGKQAKEDA